MIRAFFLTIFGIMLLALGACDWMPGKPTRSEEIMIPTAMTNFQAIYNQNCAGCHGIGDNLTGSIALDDPMYVALLPRETLRSIIALGVPNTLMPAFAQAQGGNVTEEQIETLTSGIEDWKTDANLGDLPPYAAAPGDAAAGQILYQAYESALRERNGEGMFQDGFMANAAFLGLTSDQHLRTLLIVGRPKLGIPNYREVLPNRPLSDQDISDMVAWLISQRKNEFGQPLVAPKSLPVPMPEPVSIPTPGSPDASPTDSTSDE